MRLWASTAHCSQAALAKNLPDGQCSSPAPSLRSRMASSTVAWSRWNWSTSTASPSRSVRNAWCRQSGHSCAWAAVGEAGAAHDEAQLAPVPRARSRRSSRRPGLGRRRGSRSSARRPRRSPSIAAAMTWVLMRDRHRVAHVEPVERVDQRRWTRTPSRRAPSRSPVAPARRTRAMSSSMNRLAPRGVGRALAHPGVQHLAGVGPGGQDRVVAEHLRVAEAAPCLCLPCDLADRRVHIDRHRRRARPGAQRPGPRGSSRRSPRRAGGHDRT